MRIAPNLFMMVHYMTDQTLGHFFGFGLFSFDPRFHRGKDMTTIIETDRTTERTLAAEDVYFVGADVEVIVSTSGTSAIDASSFAADNIQMFIDGTVIGASTTNVTTGDGYGIYSGGDSVHISIGTTGHVFGYDRGIYLGGDNAILINDGLIEARDDVAVYLSTSSDTKVVNNGTMRSSGNDLIFSFANASPVDIINYGEMLGGKLWAQSGDMIIQNHGLIDAYNSSEAIDADFGINTLELNNTGTIRSLGTFAITIDGEDDVIRNTGTIEGGISSSNGTGGATVINQGLVGGLIDLGTAADRYRGNGWLDDSLIMDGGADVVSNRGHITGTVFLGDGDDIYKGGGTVGEHVDGGDGADDIKGGNGEDDLRGGLAADLLQGRNGDDFLDGGKGHDTLKGGRGDDTLDGGNGDDELHAGRGADMLTGGIGDDIFVFNRHAENVTITDFTNSEDKIDLSDFGLRNSDFGALISPNITQAASSDVFLDLDVIGGTGSILIQGLALADVSSDDFIL